MATLLAPFEFRPELNLERKVNEPMKFVTPDEPDVILISSPTVLLNIGDDSEASTGYVHRVSPKRHIDPYPELQTNPDNRIPAWKLWENQKMAAFAPGANCHGYMPDGNYPCRSKNRHHGIDCSVYHPYRVNGKDGIVAPFDGLIISSRWVDGYGNRIELRLNESGVILMYNHTTKVQVKSGQEVKAGQLLAFEGCTGMGNSCSEHLHIEACDGNAIKWEQYVNTGLPLPGSLRNSQVLWNPWYVLDFARSEKV